MPSNARSRRIIAGSRRPELESQPVHAEALAGRFRAVVEDVAEMAAAAPAMNLGPDHEKRAVGPGPNRVGERRGEARPAGAAVIFGGRAVDRQIAAGAQEGAAAMLL